MDAEKTIFHPWLMDDFPAGSTIWVRGVGQLQGYGQSRRKMLLPELIPHMVIAGSGTYKCEGQVISVKTGDLFTIWPGLAYEFYENPNDPWQFYWLHVLGEGMEDFGKACGFGPNKFVLTPKYPERIIETFRHLFDYYGRSPALRDSFHALSLLNKWVAELRAGLGLNTSSQENLSSYSSLVKDAIALADTLLDTGINVNELANRLATSRNTLLLAFRDQLHKTPVEYLTERRLARAEDLLAQTNWTISAISDACGFRNEKYFMRVFKQHHGKSPSMFRQSI